MENGKELSQSINNIKIIKNLSPEDIGKKVLLLIEKFLDKDELNNMKNYHEYISRGTGLVIGDLRKENLNNLKKIDNEELIYEKCFMCYIRDFFQNNKKITLKKNKIKEKLFDILNCQKEETLLLFNILLFVVQNI